MVSFSDLKGVVLSKIVGLEVGSEYVTFIAADGREWHMHHHQDCCESVSVEDVVGSPEFLLDTEILMADESRNHGEVGYESCTWTFYKLATVKGYVDIRWYGVSNGYYSEEVSFYQVK